MNLSPDPLGNPLTTRPIQMGREFTIGSYPSGRFGCLDDPDCQFGNCSIWTLTRTRSESPELVLTPPKETEEEMNTSIVGKLLIDLARDQPEARSGSIMPDDTTAEIPITTDNKESLSPVKIPATTEMTVVQTSFETVHNMMLPKMAMVARRSGRFDCGF